MADEIFANPVVLPLTFQLIERLTMESNDYNDVAIDLVSSREKLVKFKMILVSGVIMVFNRRARLLASFMLRSTYFY